MVIYSWRSASYMNNRGFLRKTLSDRSPPRLVPPQVGTAMVYMKTVYITPSPPPSPPSPPLPPSSLFPPRFSLLSSSSPLGWVFADDWSSGSALFDGADAGGAGVGAGGAGRGFRGAFGVWGGVNGGVV
jgi:hypothetical protein